MEGNKWQPLPLLTSFHCYIHSIALLCSSLPCLDSTISAISYLFLDAAIPISPINCNLNDKNQSSLTHNTAQLLATWLMHMLPFNTLKL